MKTISRTKAIELILNSKGRFFSVIFEKKDNTLRKMNVRYLSKDTKPTNLGYIKLLDIPFKKIKNVNLQTLSQININKETYKIK